MKIIIIEVTGDIFDCVDTYNLDAIVNPVNCVGVMGKGLALKFKNRYPEYFKNYYKNCKKGLLDLDRINTYVIKRNHTKENNNSFLNKYFYIISFPTKYDWRDKSDINQI